MSTTKTSTIESDTHETWEIWMRYSPADLKAMIARACQRVEAGEEELNHSVVLMRKALEIQTTR